MTRPGVEVNIPQGRVDVAQEGAQVIGSFERALEHVAPDQLVRVVRANEPLAEGYGPAVGHHVQRFDVAIGVEGNEAYETALEHHGLRLQRYAGR